MTMTLVQTVTVGAGGAASIEFTGIPQTGTDLLLVLSVRNDDGSNSNTNLRINNNSGSVYTFRNLRGDGSSAFSGTNAVGTLDYSLYMNNAGTTSNTFSNLQYYFANYTSSTNKSISADGVTENNATSAIPAIGAIKVADTNAITRITFAPYSGNLVQHSTASLYIITKGSGGATVS